MFTGIIQAVGIIKQMLPLADGARVMVGSGALAMDDVALGDSIAVNGVCLTVVKFSPGMFAVDVSRETLDCTTGFAEGRRVNLEKALRLADRLGGHLVSGHVDGVGKVRHFVAHGESTLLAVHAPQELARYIARKGSIAVDGVSLTVNAVHGSEFEVNLIPHTLAATAFQELAPGAAVNLEVDMIARYVERVTNLTQSKNDDD